MTVKFKTKEVHLLILLMIAVFLSGCVTPSVSNGVVIEIFEPSFTQVYPGEPVKFQLKIKNTGTVDAFDVIPKISGVGDWKKGKGTCELLHGIKLSAVIPEQGIDGESKNCFWIYEAPEIPGGFSIDYDSIKATIYYNYRTNVVKGLWIASQRELINIQQRGNAIPAETVSSTSGPVSIIIQTKGPIRVWEDSVSFPLEIKLENVGGGVVCPSVTDCLEANDWNKLSLKVKTTQDITVSDCNGLITLSRGKYNTVVCETTISDLSNINIMKKTIEVEAFYGYFTEKKTSVTVKPR